MYIGEPPYTGLSPPKALHLIATIGALELNGNIAGERLKSLLAMHFKEDAVRRGSTEELSSYAFLRNGYSLLEIGILSYHSLGPRVNFPGT